MSEEGFDFFQGHSMCYLEMAFRTDRQERLENPDAYGKRTGECGDTVEFFLMVRNGFISNVSYEIDGCMNTNACANAVAEMIEGKPVENAWDITPEKVIVFLDTLPPQSYHCAELAVGALYLALSDAAKKHRSKKPIPATAAG
jgi:nitrogen fixation protein NifU and related proteins